MVTKYEVNRQLLEMGRIDVVGPPRDFVDLLGQRLDAIASTQAEYAPASDPPRRQRVPSVWCSLLPLRRCALVVAAIVFAVDNGSSAYALDDPFNVQVQFADGHFVDGTDGLKVPKGAQSSSAQADPCAFAIACHREGM